MTGLKLRFIKPCRETDSSPDLTVSRVIENKNRNTETVLFLDLNILIRMEDVILRGGDPVQLGLMSLVNFLNQCPPASVCLVPGLALSEVHPKFKNQCQELFDIFLSIFSPQMVDHPTAIKSSEGECESTRKREFHELSLGEQHLHSISFYSLIQIHIINSRYNDCSGIEKFNLYMDAVCKDIDMLSAVEAEIAKYCFCTHKDIYSEHLNDRIQAIKENFLDRHSKPKMHLANIFNGVQDLKYGKSALKFSEKMFYGKNQETWVVTLDSKLYWLSESIHHYPQKGEPDSKFFCIVRDHEQNNCEYWRAVDGALYRRLEERKLRGNYNTPLTEERMKEILKTLIDKGFNDFYKEFG